MGFVPGCKRDVGAVIGQAAMEEEGRREKGRDSPIGETNSWSVEACSGRQFSSSRELFSAIFLAAVLESLELLSKVSW